MTTNHRLFFYCNFLLPKKEWLLAILVMLFTTFNASAQQANIVKGIVTSSKDSSPLPGANVLVKGTNTTASTGFDGEFAINAKPNDVLLISYLGFDTQEITVVNNLKINISLVESSNKLNEVVVIGYGTQRKADLTGAVSVVNVEEAKKTVTYDVGKLLQGQAAGVTVQSSGEPGGFVNLKIRGVTSFYNNNPLFVIDGMIVSDPGDFSTGDIESMQVLKDASSAAIYGSLGANGVVIITTKKGKKGSLDIKYKSQFGVQTVSKRWDVLNRTQYQQTTNAAETNAGIGLAPGNDPSSPSFISNVDTDWQDSAFKTGTISDNSLTISGGAESMTYNLNVDYFKNSSYVDTPQDYKRATTTLNLGGKKGKFTYGAKIGYTQSNKNLFSEYNPGETGIADLLTSIPTVPVYDANNLGGYGGAVNATQRAIMLNTIGFNNLITNEALRNRFVGDIWGQLEIIEGLNYKFDASADILDTHDRFFNPPSNLGWYYVTEPAESQLRVTDTNRTRTILNNIITYAKQIGDNKFDVMLGMLQENNDFYNHYSAGTGYQPGEISMLQYADQTASTEYKSKQTSKSYISRINYSYDDRYFIQANFRQDKTSLFAPENNTGNFYSFSGGWKFSNEKFLKMPEWINSAKLRGSYGILGNNTLGVYSYASTINPFASYAFGNPAVLAPGTTTVTATDPNIKWEDSKQSDIGLDLGLFNNRLQVTAEYFVKESSDLLLNLPLPYSTGSFPASIVTNAGTVRNSGYELTVLYNNNDHAFKYSINANIGTLKNEVLKLGENNDPIFGLASKTEVGRSVGEIFAYQTDGIFQNQAEIAASPTQIGAAPGDIKFKDVNGDGEITSDDRTYQGVTIPKYTYAFGFDSSYKNWEFSFSWIGSGGNKAFDGTYRTLMLGQYVNSSTDILNYWTPTNTNTDIPRPVIGDPNANSRDSNRYVENASYLKLQNIQIGYNIPVQNNKVIKSAKLFVTGQNLWTITNYRGYDPDFNNEGLISRGYDQGAFPNPTSFILGLDVAF